MRTTSTLRQRWFAWIYRYVDRVQKPFTARTRTALLGDLEGDVLDVGCGPGTNFAHYRAGARVVAIDYNPGMVAMARQHLTARSWSAAIEVHQADATALPFEDASFDAYVSTLVLCSVPDLDAAVDEAWRVLRPGGQLRIFEHVRSDAAWKARLQGWLNPAWGYVADGCRLDRDTQGAFVRRGFEVIEEQRPSIPAEPLPLIILRARKPGGDAS
ncbi:MAG: class I SAM-dependent methyltransferase [Dehalococcoidia bacterium]